MSSQLGEVSFFLEAEGEEVLVDLPNEDSWPRLPMCRLTLRLDKAEEDSGKQSGTGSLEPQVRTVKRMFEGIGEAKTSSKGKRGTGELDLGFGLDPGKGETQD